MQDNYPHEFDEQFISQAWLEMRRLLDKEMPLRQKRRPAWWLWLLGGLLLAVLAGSAYYFFRPGPAATAPTAGLELPADNGPDARPSEETRTSGRNGLAADENSPSAKRPQPAGQAGTARPPGEKKPGREAPSEREVHPLISTPHPVAAAKQQIKREDSQQGQDIAAALPTGQPAGNEKAGQLFIPPAPLGSTPVSFLPYSRQEVLSGLIRPACKRPALLRLALEGSGYFPAFSTPGGFGGGLALEARPRASQLYWRTGVFFRTYEQGLRVEENAIRLENSSIKIPQPDGSLANAQNRLIAYSTIGRSHYLQLPLLAGLQWKPRLAFEAGIQLGFLLSSKAESSWRLSPESSTPTPGMPQPENNSIYKFGESSGKQELNGTSLDIIAGLAYRPSARTSLRLAYQHGLSDILESPRQAAHIRGLQLSVAYYLAP